MNEDTAKHGRMWPVVCVSLAFVLPVLYIASSGPVLKVAAASPSANSLAVLAYLPVISFANDGEDNLLQRYLMWWCPEGLVVPIYSSNRDLRARELVYTPSSAEAEESTPERDCRDTSINSPIAENASRSLNAAAPVASEEDYGTESDGLTRWLESPKAHGPNRNLRFH